MQEERANGRLAGHLRASHAGDVGNTIRRAWQEDGGIGLAAVKEYDQAVTEAIAEYDAIQTHGHALCDAADALLRLYAVMNPGAPDDTTPGEVVTLMDTMDGLRAVLGNPDEDCEIDVFYTIDGPPWADVRYEDREEAISLGKRQGRAVIEHTSRHTDTVVYEPDEAEGDKSARQRMVERGQ